MPTVIIPPTDVSPNTGSGSEVLATNPTFPANITVSGTTQSNDKDTGAIVTEGGLGVEKNANIGGNATVGGTLAVGGVTTISASANVNGLLTAGAASGFDANNTLNIAGAKAGISIHNSVAGSSNNWSTIRNTATLSQSNLVFTVGAGDSLTLAHNKDATLTGNLTVSGTGTSTIASATLFRATTGPGGVFTLQHGDGSADTRALFWPNGAFALALRNGAGTGSYYIGATAASSPDLVFSANSGTENARLTSDGNFLLGTPTDGGQKLQVAGTGYFTGNVNVYKTSGEAALQADYSTTYVKIFNDSSSLGLYSNSWGGLLTFTKSTEATTVEGKSIALKPNGTTALTLDSSQVASFAKKFGNSGTTSISGDVACSVVNVSASGYGLRVQGGVVSGGYVLSALDYAGTERLRLEANGEMYVRNVDSAPASTPSSGGFLYIESGALKYKGSSGTVTTIANA